jgi:hypothetical protein
MNTPIPGLSYRQLVFREMVLGTLVYSLVLGFFSDYTNLLSVVTQSTVFAVAIVLQVLTFLTFRLKDVVIDLVKKRKGKYYKPTLILSIWLIMFMSKFVFLWVIDLIFGATVDISGFIGLLLIVIAMTAVKQLIDIIYQRLAD